MYICFNFYIKQTKKQTNRSQMHTTNKHSKQTNNAKADRNTQGCSTPKPPTLSQNG